MGMSIMAQIREAGEVYDKYRARHDYSYPERLEFNIKLRGAAGYAYPPRVQALIDAGAVSEELAYEQHADICGYELWGTLEAFVAQHPGVTWLEPGRDENAPYWRGVGPRNWYTTGRSGGWLSVPSPWPYHEEPDNWQDWHDYIVGARQVAVLAEHLREAVDAASAYLMVDGEDGPWADFIEQYEDELHHGAVGSVERDIIEMIEGAGAMRDCDALLDEIAARCRRAIERRVTA